MSQAEEFKPLLNWPSICPPNVKEQLRAMNVYTQNTDDTVHARKNAAAVEEAKSPFHRERSFKASSVHCLKLLGCSQATSNWLRLPTWFNTMLRWVASSSPAETAVLPSRCMVSRGSEQLWSSTAQLSVGTEHAGLAQGVATGESMEMLPSCVGNWAKQWKRRQRWRKIIKKRKGKVWKKKKSGTNKQYRTYIDKTSNTD